MTPTATLDPNCNRAVFIEDVTIPDNTLLRASSLFTKTWRIKNEGTCTWTAGYKLIFQNGSQMGGPAGTSLPTQVAPGGTIDISINLSAPSEPGRYQGFWLLQSSSGETFGVGRQANEPVWVKIRVEPAPAGPPTSTVSALPTAGATLTVMPPVLPAETIPYDFAEAACTAQWAGDAGALLCPGPQRSAGGSVLPLEQVEMEDGTTATVHSLLLQPPSTAGGNVQGLYPEYDVQPGDRFRAVVGCQKGALSCSVLFTLAYQDQAGMMHDLWSIGEFYDGRTFDLDMDLSQLAGQKVKFILAISSLGSPEGDRAIWIDPRIVHVELPTMTPTVIPTLTPTPTFLPATATPTTLPSALPTSLAPLPTPTPAGSAGQPPSSGIQQLIASILNFFRQLFGK